MKWFSAMLIAATVLTSGIAMAFSAARPTRADLPALRTEIRKNASSQLGVPPSQVKVKITLDPRTPKGFLGDGYSAGTATADGKTITYRIVMGSNGKFVADPLHVTIMAKK
jgi:hypothetical protein